MNALNQYRYTDSEKKQIFKNMVILIDSQEKINGHIIQWLDKNKVKYEAKRLGFGDYSFKLQALPELGINRDIYFDKSVTIERKNSLEELSQSMAQNRDRFGNEFLRARDSVKILMVEKGSYEDVLAGAYNTKFSSEAYFSSLISFQLKYNLNICFVGREYAGKFIYGQCYQYLRLWLG